jgi:hypothetical protein
LPYDSPFNNFDLHRALNCTCLLFAAGQRCPGPLYAPERLGPTHLDLQAVGLNAAKFMPRTNIFLESNTYDALHHALTACKYFRRTTGYSNYSLAFTVSDREHAFAPNGGAQST